MMGMTLIPRSSCGRCTRPSPASPICWPTRYVPRHLPLYVWSRALRAHPTTGRAGELSPVAGPDHIAPARDADGHLQPGRRARRPGGAAAVGRVQAGRDRGAAVRGGRAPGGALPHAGPAGRSRCGRAARLRAISATCPTPPAARARAQRNEVSAAVAAGVYFEERRSLLVSLWMLLQAQVGPPPARLPGQAQATSVRSTQRCPCRAVAGPAATS